MNETIKITKLNKIYDTGAVQVHALKNINLTIEKGDDDASTSLVRSATLKKNAMWTISDEQKAAALAKGWTII